MAYTRHTSEHVCDFCTSEIVFWIALSVQLHVIHPTDLSMKLIFMEWVKKKKGLLWPLSRFLCNNNSKGWFLENTFVFLLGSWNFVWFHIFFSLKYIIFSHSVIASNMNSTRSQEWKRVSSFSISSALIPPLWFLLV